jgi:hypothetical protein
MAGGGLGRERGNITIPVLAGPEEVGGDDDGRCSSGDARVEGGADRRFREFHVRGVDDDVTAARLPLGDEVPVTSVPFGPTRTVVDYDDAYGIPLQAGGHVGHRIFGRIEITMPVHSETRASPERRNESFGLGEGERDPGMTK